MLHWTRGGQHAAHPLTLARLLAAGLALWAMALLPAHAQTAGAGSSSPTGSTATAPADAAPAPRILVVGDSLSAEYGLARGTGWVALLEQRLQEQQIPATLVNASVSGDTTSGGASRLPALLQNHEPDLVIIELGGNDALRGLPLNLTADNLAKMVQQSQQAGADVVLVGMQIPPNYGPAYSRQFAELFGEVAQEHNAALVPFLLEGIATDAASFQDDGIHPNEEAQPVLLENVWPVLSETLGVS